ncbi:MAG: glycosyltransferase family 2 protein [SAR324 cluster bacterium]|nr:glycosyltransferase family 2 protein [SAR324 cluster bacterium]
MSPENPKSSPRILIMLPCYNEEATIGGLLKEIQEMNSEYDTLVIDDGSQDQTFQIASALSPCIKLAVNLGIGGAIQTAIKYAYDNGYDFCIQVDGDGQHPPNQIQVLLENHEVSSASLVVGSRFIMDNQFQSTPARRVGIKIISKVIKGVFHFKITDPTSGFRLMDRKAMSLFSKRYPVDFPEPISLAIALEEDLLIAETPVVMKARETGVSSIIGLKTIAYMIRVVGYLFLIRIGRHI